MRLWLKITYAISSMCYLFPCYRSYSHKNIRTWTCFSKTGTGYHERNCSLCKRPDALTFETKAQLQALVIWHFLQYLHHHRTLLHILCTKKTTLPRMRLDRPVRAKVVRKIRTSVKKKKSAKILSRPKTETWPDPIPEESAVKQFSDRESEISCSASESEKGTNTCFAVFVRNVQSHVWSI